MYKDNQERIDAYLRGEMTDGQKSLFEADLKADDALRSDYLLTQAIAGALADRQKKLDLIRQWEKEFEDDGDEDLRAACATSAPGPAAASRPRRHLRKWMVGIGVAACLAIGYVTVKNVTYLDSPSGSNISQSSPDFRTSPSAAGGYVMPDFGTDAMYRGGNSDISLVDTLISRNDYISALSSIDSLVTDYSASIRSYENMDSLTERDEYMVLLNRDALYQLEWRQIHLLIALHREKEAAKLLIPYREKEGIYKAEADSLLKTLAP